MKKRLLSVIIAALMVIALVPMSISAREADEEIVPGFIEPISHRTTVPAGYTPLYNRDDITKVRENLSGNFILMNDIDMLFLGFEPIGAYDVDSLTEESTFSGVFDGNGYTIKNLDITVTGTKANLYAGLFAAVSGEVKNLCVSGNMLATSNTSLYAGGIAGYLTTDGTIENCINKITVIGSCDSVAANTIKSNSGGIVGESLGTILSCQNFVPVNGRRAGGIIGIMTNGKVSGCYNSGDVAASSSLGDTWAGGIAGETHNNAEIEYCKNYGTINTNTNCSGGFSSFAGGLVGRSYSVNISFSYNVGNVTSNAYSSSYCCSYAGGFIGYAANTIIQNGFNEGDIKAILNGYSNDYIYSNYGGIIGEAAGGVVLRAIYNIGNATGSVTNRWSSYRVSYNGGMMIGLSSGSVAPVITYCYWSSSVGNSAVGSSSGAVTQNNVKSLTEEEMKSQDSFIGFPFGYYWTMDGNPDYPYPELSNLTYTETNTVCEHNNWGEWVTVKSATCHDSGREMRTCNECGSTQFRETEKLEHTWGEWRSELSEECEAHTKHVRACTVCGDVDVNISSSGITDWIIESLPTHTTTGLRYKKCTNCNVRFEEEIIPVISHSYTEKVVPSTCTERGYTEAVCSCGDSYRYNYTPRIEHAWVDVVVNDPTHTTPGVTVRQCSSCGTREGNITVPAIGHDYKTTVYPANCTERGYTEAVCSCGESYRYDYTAPIGHKWSAWEIYVKGDGYEPVGRRTCSECKEVEEIADILCIETINRKANVGQTIRVPVKIKNNPGVTSVRISVSFGSELVLDSVAFDKSVGGYFDYTETKTSPVIITWVIGDQNYDSDFTLAYLVFTVSENADEGAKSEIGISYDYKDIFTTEETEIPAVVTSGSVTVADYLLGDINSDSSRDIKDALRLLKYVSGNEVVVNKEALDINGDGYVNNKDVTRLLQILAGWNVELY